MFISWRIDQLQKYQKKKRGLDFNWMWIFILIMMGIGGMIIVIIFILPSIGRVVAVISPTLLHMSGVV